MAMMFVYKLIYNNMPNIVTMEFIAEAILINQKLLEDILARVKRIEDNVEESSLLNKEIDDLFNEKTEPGNEDDDTRVERIRENTFRY
jgi:hypothetical protein